MKTTKAIQPSVVITLDDIVFSNRNQTYGAYYLRKKYNRHLLIALLLVVLLLASGTTIPMIWKFIFPDKPVSQDTPVKPFITIIYTKPIDVPLPPPLKTDPPREIIKNTRFGTYMVVDSLINKDTTSHVALPTDKIYGNSHGDTLFVSIDTSHIIPPEEYFTGGIGEPATFGGDGLEKFHDWVQGNISYPTDASEAGIEGKVTVSFVVNKYGEVNEVNVLRGVHASIDKETLRAILSSPKWQPAKQNGNPVKQRFYMQVTYKLQ